MLPYGSHDSLLYPYCHSIKSLVNYCRFRLPNLTCAPPGNRCGASGREYQLELIDLQCSQSSDDDFYKKYILPSGKYKNVLTNAKLIISLFGGTYVCEQLFSKMKYTESHLRTRLRHNHLHDVLRLSSTNISPDVEKLSHNKQKQVPRISFVARNLLFVCLFVFCCCFFF